MTMIVMMVEMMVEVMVEMMVEMMVEIPDEARSCRLPYQLIRVNLCVGNPRQDMDKLLQNDATD